MFTEVGLFTETLPRLELRSSLASASANFCTFKQGKAPKAPGSRHSDGRGVDLRLRVPRDPRSPIPPSTVPGIAAIPTRQDYRLKESDRKLEKCVAPNYASRGDRDATTWWQQQGTQMADNRTELRKTLRDAIKYRVTIQQYTALREDIKGLGLSTDPDADRGPAPNPYHSSYDTSREVQALREDANEAVHEATQALALELGRLGYPTIERTHREDEPSGAAAMDIICQREADSKGRRIRFTASKNDVKIYKPKGA